MRYQSGGVTLILHPHSMMSKWMKMCLGKKCSAHASDQNFIRMSTPYTVIKTQDVYTIHCMFLHAPGELHSPGKLHTPFRMSTP